jgi:hypothetical protein
LDNIGQKSFRLLKKIKDPKFEIDRLEIYSLSLFIGSRDFQILITDSETNHCILLEDYVFDPTIEEQDKFDVIKFIFDDHHLLLANFWKKINLITKSKAFSFVPKNLFEVDRIASYLGMNATFDPTQEELMLTYHKKLDFVNVFSVNKSIVGLISKVYPDRRVNYIHQSSSLINGVIAINENGEKEIIIYLDRFGMHILIAEDNKLVFYNQYSIKKFDDYIKFIKMVAKEFDFDLEEVKIRLYGYLGKNTPHFNELKKTMPQLILGNRPNNLNFGYVFDEVMEHQYFDLFSTETFRI